MRKNGIYFFNDMTYIEHPKRQEGACRQKRNEHAKKRVKRWNKLVDQIKRGQNLYIQAY
jgi:hypothetical protein